MSYGGLPLAAAASHSFTVSGSTPVRKVLTFAVDEFLTLDWFGESCPPYWRRNLPLNDTTTLPLDMLSSAWVSYASVRSLADAFDAKTAGMLSSVGGDQYATVTQLVSKLKAAAMRVLCPSFCVPYLGCTAVTPLYAPLHPHPISPAAVPPGCGRRAADLDSLQADGVVDAQGDLLMRLPEHSRRHLPRIRSLPVLPARTHEAHVSGRRGFGMYQ